jgi:glutamate/aspartate transport system ATP-binding protein
MITLSKVSKWYPNFQVLNHCSTEVAKGEVVVVCGPSGSGKSTHPGAGALHRIRSCG